MRSGRLEGPRATNDFIWRTGNRVVEEADREPAVVPRLGIVCISPRGTAGFDAGADQRIQTARDTQARGARRWSQRFANGRWRTSVGS